MAFTGLLFKRRVIHYDCAQSDVAEHLIKLIKEKNMDVENRHLNVIIIPCHGPREYVLRGIVSKQNVLSVGMYVNDSLHASRRV